MVTSKETIRKRNDTILHKRVIKMPLGVMIGIIGITLAVTEIGVILLEYP
jgi:hypothetical protein